MYTLSHQADHANSPTIISLGRHCPVEAGCLIVPVVDLSVDESLLTFTVFSTCTGKIQSHIPVIQELLKQLILARFNRSLVEVALETLE